MEQEYIDDRRRGTAPLRGLKPYTTEEIDAQWNPRIRDLMREHNEDAFHPERLVNYRQQLRNQAYEYLDDQFPTNPHYGASKYDYTMPKWSTDEELEENRARNQSSGRKLLFGAANMLTKASTTFVDGFAGTLVGAFNGLNSLSEGKGYLEGFVNNPVSIWLNSINDYVADEAKVYHTRAWEQQREDNWLGNVGTADFWAGFLDNMGFTVGMAGSMVLTGGVIGAATGAGKAGKVIREGAKQIVKSGADDLARAGMTEAQRINFVESQILNGKRTLAGMNVDKALVDAAKGLRTNNLISQTVGSFVAAQAEARTEGIHAVKEYKDEMSAKLNSVNGMLELRARTYEQLFNELGREPLPEEFDAAVERNYKQAEASIEAQGDKMTGMIFGLNVGILTVSNLVGWSKWARVKAFGNPNKITGAAARVTEQTNAAGQLEKLVMNNGGYGMATYKALKRPITEGMEEMSQAVAAQSAKNYYGQHVNRPGTFMGIEYDREASKNVYSRWEAITKATGETMGAWKNWEEFGYGFIMGALGLPSIGRSNTTNGRRVQWNDSAWSPFTQTRKDNKAMADAVEIANKRLNDPDFKAYYSGLRRHEALDRKKEEAVEVEDEFALRNSEYSQFISDLIMFDKVGKIDVISNIIKENVARLERLQGEDKNLSDEQRAERDEWVDTMKAVFKGQEGDTAAKSPLDGLSPQAIAEKALKWAKGAENNIDSYGSIIENTRKLFGNKLDDESFSEMVFLVGNMDNMETRANEVRSTIERIIKEQGKENVKLKFTVDGEQMEMTFPEILREYHGRDLYDIFFGKDEAKKAINSETNSFMNELLNAIPGTAISSTEDILNRYNALKEKAIKTKPTEESTNMLQWVEHNKAMDELDKFVAAIDSRHHMQQLTTDYFRIIFAREKLIHVLNGYRLHPEKIQEEIQADKANAEEERKDEQFEAAWEDLLKSNTPREAINQLLDPNGVDDNSLARRLRQRLVREGLDPLKPGYNPVVAEAYRMIQLRDEMLGYISSVREKTTPVVPLDLDGTGVEMPELEPVGESDKLVLEFADVLEHVIDNLFQQARDVNEMFNMDIEVARGLSSDSRQESYNTLIKQVMDNRHVEGIEGYRQVIDQVREAHRTILNSIDKTKYEATASEVETNEKEEVKPEKQEEINAKSLNEDQANKLIKLMEENASEAPRVELTPENWAAEFGRHGTVTTPLGVVKMGENQLEKLFFKGRQAEFGMIRPTLADPDVIVEKSAPDSNAERQTKLLFIKTFTSKDGSKYIHFESVTVQKDGMEVSISSHVVEEKAIAKELVNGTIAYNKFANRSEGYLPENPEGQPDIVPTQANSQDKGKENNPTGDNTGTGNVNLEETKTESVKPGESKVESPKTEENNSENDKYDDLAKNRAEIEFDTTVWDDVTQTSHKEKGRSNILNLAGRMTVVVTINGRNIPFYLSTGHGGKVDVTSGKWYPFFGIANGWFNKLSGKQINDYYGIPELRYISEALDRVIGDIRDDQSVPKAGIEGAHMDFINKDMHPTDNETSDTKRLINQSIQETKDFFEGLNRDNAATETTVTEESPTLESELLKIVDPNGTRGTTIEVEEVYEEDDSSPRPQIDSAPFKPISRNDLDSLAEWLKRTGLAKDVVIDREAYQRAYDKWAHKLSGQDGQVYGFVTKSGIIYLNPDQVNANTPIHEFGHLWNTYIQQNNKELWARGVELAKQSGEWNKVKASLGSYGLKGNATDEEIADEILVRLYGNRGEEVFREEGIGERLRSWIREVWEWIGSQLGIRDMTAEQISSLTLEQFVNGAVADMLGGQEINSSRFSENQEGSRNLENNGTDPLTNGQTGSTFVQNKNLNNGNGREQQASDRVSRTFEQAARELDAGTEDSGSIQATGAEQQNAGSAERVGQLERLAKENGAWIENPGELIHADQPVGSGFESEVFMSTDGRNVIKFNSNYTKDLTNSFDLRYFLKRIEAHNEFAPEAAYTILGIGKNSKGEISVILEQLLVKGKPAPIEKVMQYLKARGFRPLGSKDGANVFTNSRYEISDLWKGGSNMLSDNVLIDDEGNLYFIDTDISKIAQEGDYFSEEDYDFEDDEPRFAFHATPHNLIGTRYKIKYNGDPSFASVKNFTDSGLGIDASSLDPNDSFMIREAYVPADRQNAYISVYAASAPSEAIVLPFAAERILQQQEDVIEAKNEELETSSEEVEEPVDPARVPTIVESAGDPVNPEETPAATVTTLTTGVSEHDPLVYSQDGKWVPKDDASVSDQHDPQLRAKVSFLRTVGAFDYLNEGKLKPGTEVHVLADPAYWQELMAVTRPDGTKNRAEVFQEFPLLFAVKVPKATDTTRTIGGVHYQIIGTFPWKDSKKIAAADANFKNKANNALRKDSTDRSPFIVNRPGTGEPIITQVTRVSQGILNFSAQEDKRPLRQSLHDPSAEVVLAVRRKNNLVTSKAGITVLNDEGLHTEKNAGAPYLLVQTGDRSKKEYIPVHLIPKNFADETFDMNATSFFMTKLKHSLWNLANVRLPRKPDGRLDGVSEAVDNAYKQLKESIYLSSNNGVSIHAKIQQNANDPSRADSIALEFINRSRVEGDPRPRDQWETEIVPLATVDETLNYVRRKPEDIYRDIIRVFAKFKIPVSVSASKIASSGSKAYIQELLDADVLHSNLLDDRVKSVYATMRELDDKFEMTGPAIPAIDEDALDSTESPAVATKETASSPIVEENIDDVMMLDQARFREEDFTDDMADSVDTVASEETDINCKLA